MTRVTSQRIGWLPLLTALLLAAAPATALGQKGNARGGDAAAGVVWRSWEAGREEAARTGRPMLVDVYTDWCGWCKRMDRDTYARAEVREYLNERFVPVKLNPESSREARAAANEYRVTGYPTTIFLKSGGAHLVSVPGYVEPGRFLTLLRYVAEGHMERQVPFEDFARRVESGR